MERTHIRTERFFYYLKYKNPYTYRILYCILKELKGKTLSAASLFRMNMLVKVLFTGKPQSKPLFKFKCARYYRQKKENQLSGHRNRFEIDSLMFKAYDI